MQPNALLSPFTAASVFSLVVSLPSSSAAPWNSDNNLQNTMSFNRQYNGRSSSASVSAAAGGYYYGQQPLVHTFETQSSCLRRCVAGCVMQNVEDLMMPRWICNSEQAASETPGNMFAESNYSSWLVFDSQFILLLVPLVLVLLIILIIILVRRSSSSGSMDDLV